MRFESLRVLCENLQVTCMEVVLEEGGATMLSKSFAQNLRWFFGIVAVGTDGGHLFLIDLRFFQTQSIADCLLSCLNFVRYVWCCIFRLDDSMDEYSHPSPIQTVPTVVRDVPQTRDKVHECNAHIAFELLGKFFQKPKP